MTRDQRELLLFPVVLSIAACSVSLTGLAFAVGYLSGSARERIGWLALRVALLIRQR